MALRVAIIEDHKGFREGIAFILQSTEGFICLGEFGNAEEALNLMPEADALLLDINLPGISGTDAIPLLKKKYPKIKIIMLTIFEDDQKILHSILNGADGYLLKKTPPLKILQAIEDVIAGGAPLTPIVAKQTLELFRKYAPAGNTSSDLTNRETEILKMIVNGMSNEQISNELFISIQTIRNHIRHIYEKLQVHSKSQAVVKAIKLGII
ncbi:MAG: response regulator [Bacillota bacterium]